MTKQRLSDYARYQTRGSGFTVRTRSDTGRSNHFGDAGSVTFTDDEARELYDILKERYEEDN